MAVTTFATGPRNRGEKVVGAATVQLVSAATPCQRVWIGAPTSAHPKAGTNSATILVGDTTLQTSSAGAKPLTSDNAAGYYEHVNDASQIWLKGSASGDAVEYCIE